MFKLEKKHLLILLGCATAAIMLILFALADNAGKRAASAPSREAEPVFIVDAGHGGPDGGAVGSDGTLEKDINLAIALRLRDFLRAFGCEVIMTREDDRSIHSESSITIRQKKVSDIHNRTALVNGTEGAVLISIHQNKFPGAGEKGTQVFYSPNDPESQLLALRIQERVKTLLQPENRRKIKPAGNNIYLLTYAEAPAVLVECGFLSNPGEREKLKTPEYQEQIAFVIACAVMGGDR